MANTQTPNNNGQQTSQPQDQSRARQRANQDGPSLKDIAEKLKQQNDDKAKQEGAKEALKQALAISSDAFKKGNVAMRKESVAALKDIRNTIQQINFKDEQEKAKYLDLYDQTLEQFEKTNKNLQKIVANSVGDKAKGVWGTIKKSIFEAQNPLFKAGYTLFQGVKESLEKIDGESEKERQNELRTISDQLNGLKPKSNQQNQNQTQSQPQPEHHSQPERIQEVQQAQPERIQESSQTRPEKVQEVPHPQPQRVQEVQQPQPEKANGDTGTKSRETKKSETEKQETNKTSNDKPKKDGNGPLVTAMRSVEKQTASAASILELLFDVLTSDEGIKVKLEDTPVPKKEKASAENSTLSGPTIDLDNSKILGEIFAGIELEIEEMARVNQSLDVLIKQGALQLEAQQDQRTLMEKQKLENIETQRESRVKAGSSSTVGVPESEKEGLLSQLIGGVGGIFETIFGPLTKMFKSDGFIGKIFEVIKSPMKFIGGLFEEGGAIGKFFGFFKVFGKLGGLLKGIPVIGEIVMLISGIFDFFWGFGNAKEILGKATVGLWDRISSGIGSLVGGLTNIIDTVAGWFGYNPKLEEGIREKVAKFFDAIPETIKDAASFLWDYIKGIDWKGAFMAPINAFIGVGKAILDGVMEPVKGSAGILAKALDMVGMGDTDVAKTLKTFAGDDKKKADASSDTSNLSSNSNKVSPDDLKKGDAEVAQAKDQADKTKDAKQKAANNIVDASTVVNSPVTNNYASRLNSRNDDKSHKQLAYG